MIDDTTYFQASLESTNVLEESDNKNDSFVLSSSMMSRTGNLGFELSTIIEQRDNDNDSFVI
jgi:hypothetical protein